MKKILLAAAVLMMGVGAASAQKATPWFLGGSAEVTGSKLDKDKAGALQINPQVGYMFNQNWGVALDLGFGFAKDNGVKEMSYGAGLSGLYVMKITDKFSYTPTLRLGFEMGETKTGKVKSNEYTQFGGKLEFMKFEFRPSCHWGLTFGFGGLNVNSFKYKKADKATLTGKLNVTDTTVGFKYYF